MDKEVVEFYKKLSYYYSGVADELCVKIDQIVQGNHSLLTAKLSAYDDNSLFSLALLKNEDDKLFVVVEHMLNKYKEHLLTAISVKDLEPLMDGVILRRNYKIFTLLVQTIGIDWACVNVYDQMSGKNWLHLYCDSVLSFSNFEGEILSSADKAEGSLIKLLVDNIDINSVDINGDTALHYLAVKKAYHIMRALRDAGAVIKKNKYGQTPLHFIACDEDKFNLFEPNEYKPLISLLTDANNNIHTKDNIGRTCVSIALERSTMKDPSKLLAALSEDDLEQGRKDLSSLSLLYPEFHSYFRNVFNFLTQQISQKIEKTVKSDIRVFIGEEHNNINCFFAELLIVSACHRLGFKNILIELNEDRASSGWIKNQISILNVAHFAQSLGLQHHLVDDGLKRTNSAHEPIINENLDGRNKYMLEKAEKIGGPQVWIVGAAHLEGLVVSDSDIGINVSLYDTEKAINQRLDVEHSLMFRTEDLKKIYQLVVECYKSFDSNTVNGRPLMFSENKQEETAKNTPAAEIYKSKLRSKL